MNHMPRETIEMFELIKDDGSWAIKWRGCLDAPNRGYLNDVALMRDGSLFATHMYDKGTPYWKLAYVSFAKSQTGFLYQWGLNTGFLKVPNSEGSFPNEISISDDDRSLFINYVFDRRTVKLDVESHEIQAEHFSTGTPDNSSVDGEFLWVAAQVNTSADVLLFCADAARQCSAPLTIYKLRQDNLSEVEKFSFEQTQIGLVTVGVNLKSKIWPGTFRGDRVASFELPN
tara:strand:+ start:284 stop:970 length:687 start_codon:yes stop_codon:yes gene_type:complete